MHFSLFQILPISEHFSYSMESIHNFTFFKKIQFISAKISDDTKFLTFPLYPKI